MPRLSYTKDSCCRLLFAVRCALPLLFGRNVFFSCSFLAEDGTLARLNSMDDYGGRAFKARHGAAEARRRPSHESSKTLSPTWHHRIASAGRVKTSVQFLTFTSLVAWRRRRREQSTSTPSLNRLPNPKSAKLPVLARPLSSLDPYEARRSAVRRGQPQWGSAGLLLKLLPPLMTEHPSLRLTLEAGGECRYAAPRWAGDGVSHVSKTPSKRTPKQQ